MKQLLILLILVCIGGCRSNDKIEPGEVEGIITGYVIADYWSKGCSSGGIAMTVNQSTYLISNALPSEYEQATTWPISVLVRYESPALDTCSQEVNRVKILSIRKRQ